LALKPASPIAAALFVAPAEPDKFGVAGLLPRERLRIPSALVASVSDPWMSAASARGWAARWGCHWVNLGDAGHINAESGFGPLPFARRWVLRWSGCDRQSRFAHEHRRIHSFVLGRLAP
jgi:hypothetical protein